jgi:hypothetical protein
VINVLYLEIFPYDFLLDEARVNEKIKSDEGKKGFVFGSKMTFPFNTAILNVKFRWKI